MIIFILFNMQCIRSFCDQCGHKLIPNSKFCPNCGAAVPLLQNSSAAVHLYLFYMFKNINFKDLTIMSSKLYLLITFLMWGKSGCWSHSRSFRTCFRHFWRHAAEWCSWKWKTNHFFPFFDFFPFFWFFDKFQKIIRCIISLIS